MTKFLVNFEIIDVNFNYWKKIVFSKYLRFVTYNSRDTILCTIFHLIFFTSLHNWICFYNIGKNKVF